MELRTHDFLTIAADSKLPRGVPSWVRETLSRTRTVVVRRADAPEGWVSIGMRGKARHERLGCLSRIEDVMLYRTPESLVRAGGWRLFARTSRSFPVWQALESVNAFAERERLVWGPVGSVGYQLATGIEAVTIASDLDVVVRFTVPPHRDLLEEFERVNRVNAARVDVMLEGPIGGVSLEEHLRQPDCSLIKTNRGPRIGAFVW